MPTTTESCRAIVRDVQRIGVALRRAGALDRRHQTLCRCCRRGEPAAARPVGESFVRWRVCPGARQPATARNWSTCRPRGFSQPRARHTIVRVESSARTPSRSSPAATSRAAAKILALKVEMRGFSRALWAPSQRKQRAGTALLRGSHCAGFERARSVPSFVPRRTPPTAEKRAAGITGETGLGNLGERFSRAAARRQAHRRKELAELRTFGRSLAGLRRLMHVIEAQFTPISSSKAGLVSIEVQSVTAGRVASCSGKSALG